MSMLKSHKLNCELNYCIENECCDVINNVKNESMQKLNSMSYVDKKALFCQCMLLSVNVMSLLNL